MRNLEQGQFWTPRPPVRAWGEVFETSIAAPAAGKAWKFKFPAAYIWRVVAGRVPITTSAQAANRVVSLAVLDPKGRNYYEVAASALIVASKTASVSFSSSTSPYAAEKNNPQAFMLPEMFFPPEWELEGSAEGIQTEDQFKEGRILLEGFEPQPAHPLADVENREEYIDLLREALTYAPA